MRSGAILIVGAAGLVGRHLREAFSERAVVATFHHQAVPSALPLELTERDAVMRLVREVRPSIILLAAAEPYVERCEREPAVTRRVNVAGTAYVVEAAAQNGARLAVFSSEYVFSGGRGPYAEADPIGPLNEYGRQKVEVERLARQLRDHLICRTSGVFGWELSGKNFVSQLVGRLRAGEAFVVPSDQVITPTYAPSLASAVRELVDAGHTGTFHVAGPRVVRRLDFALMAARVFGLDPRLIEPRATAELDFLAPRPLDAGLRTDRLAKSIGHRLADPEAALAEMRATERGAR